MLVGQVVVHHLLLVVGLVARACVQDHGAQSHVLVGHLAGAARDEESLLFFVGGLSRVGDDRGAIVDCVQVIPDGGGCDFAVASHLPQEDNGSAQHQSQGEQAQGERDGQGCWEATATAWSGLPCGRRGRLTILTAGAHEARWALAHGPADVGVASSSVLAGQEAAGICADAAVLSRVTQRALAGEVIYAIHAGASVLAGVAAAVVCVLLTAGPSEAWPASAHQASQIEALSTLKKENLTFKHYTTTRISSPCFTTVNAEL